MVCYGVFIWDGMATLFLRCLSYTVRLFILEYVFRLLDMAVLYVYCMFLSKHHAAAFSFHLYVYCRYRCISVFYMFYAALCLRLLI